MRQARVKQTLRMTRILLNLAGSLLFVICTVVFCLAIVRHQHQTREDLKIQSQRLESMQQAASGVQRTQAELRDALETLQRTDAELRSRIPNEANEQTILRALNEVADATGVQIVNYQRTGVAERAAYSTFRLDLHCQGDYKSLCRLLDRIGKIEHIVIVEQLRVGSDMATAKHGFTLGLVMPYGLKTNDNESGGVQDV